VKAAGRLEATRAADVAKQGTGVRERSTNGGMGWQLLGLSGMKRDRAPHGFTAKRRPMQVACLRSPVTQFTSFARKTKHGRVFLTFSGQ